MVPPERVKAEELRKAMLQAREDAQKIAAERLASESWRVALDKEREAEVALGKQDFARAQAGYGEAQQRYQTAAVEARKQIDQLTELAKVRPFQEQAAQARRRAELAEALKLAAPLWIKATEVERSADDALKQLGYVKATALYKDAEQAYKTAEAEAAKQLAKNREDQEKFEALRRDLQATEQLAAKATDARGKAEQAGAQRFALKLFALAQEREKEGQSALKAQDYPGAQRRFREAGDEYEKARLEAMKGAEAAQREAELQAQRQREAEAARTQMTQTRTQAEQADVKRYAAKLYQDALAKESEGQAALGQGQYTAATQRFKDAQQEYERARSDAVRGAEAEKREAEQSRTVTAQARTQAEQADARRYAGKLYQDALAKDSDGQAALGRGQYAAATQRFKEAQQEFDRARQEAVKGADAERQKAAADAERQRLEAERQKAAADAERQRLEAERQKAAADAERQRLEAERQKAAADAERQRLEAERQKAAADAERQRLEAERQKAAADAERQRLEAERQKAAADAERQRLEAERQKAAADAERQRVAALQRQQQEEAGRQASLKQDLDRARGAAIAGRDQALKGEADKLVRDVFEAGRTKEAEADGLARGPQVAQATAAYQDATQRYGEATRRAQVLRQDRAEADQARGRMQAEKQKARSDATEFRAGLTAEQQGDSSYQKLAFKEATGHYSTGQGLFAKAAVPTTQPRPPAADPRNEIRATLDTYKRAIENKDVGLFQQVRPNLSDAELRRVRASFEQSKSQTVDLKIDSIEVNGDEAQAKGRRLDVFVPKEGRPVQNEAPFVFKLKKTASGWVIQAVN